MTESSTPVRLDARCLCEDRAESGVKGGTDGGHGTIPCNTPLKPMQVGILFVIIPSFEGHRKTELRNNTFLVRR